MILRVHHLELLKRQLANFPVVAVLGARQVGKTTLARQLEEDWDGYLASIILAALTTIMMAG
ncbi:MAG: hypothetical protein RI993_1575 [Pseudomonadota bacterium]|jgi:predicted AAA+ superfamily ATPase